MLVLLAIQADEVEIALRTRKAFLPWQPTHPQAEFDVAERGQPGVKRVVALKDDAAIGTGTVDPAAGNFHAAGGGGLKTGGQVEDRGLAATAGAQQAEELTGLDVEVEVLNGRIIAAPERTIDFADVDEPQQGQARGPRQSHSQPAVQGSTGMRASSRGSMMQAGRELGKVRPPCARLIWRAI